MSNMSYCRFQNTLGDLRDCQYALESMASGDPEEGKLSRDELAAAKDLAVECLSLVAMLAEHIGKDLDDVDAPDMECAVQSIQDHATEEE